MMHPSSPSSPSSPSPSSSRPRPRHGFTLIELLVSVAIAMTMVAVATSAMMQMRKTVDRTTARLAMHQRAGLLAEQFAKNLAVVQHTCALVAEWVDEGTGGVTDRRLRLLYMRGIFDQNDWEYHAYGDMPKWPTPTSTDLVWELWEWRENTHTLYCASTPFVAKIIKGMAPSGGNLVLNGTNYSDTHRFMQLPQPRRTLSTTWKADLNANLLFPATPGDLTNTVSLLAGDSGDWMYLRDHLVPVVQGLHSEGQDLSRPMTWDGMIDFGIELRLHNGTTTTLSTSSALTTIIIPGVRVDGRPALGEDVGGDPPNNQSLIDAGVYGPGARPDLIRVHWTMRDRPSDMNTPFSFSLPLPGFSAVAP